MKPLAIRYSVNRLAADMSAYHDTGRWVILSPDAEGCAIRNALIRYGEIDKDDGFICVGAHPYDGCIDLTITDFTGRPAYYRLAPIKRFWSVQDFEEELVALTR